MRPAIFLDRDDTIIANHDIRDRMAHPGYLYDPALVKLLPGAAEGCATLQSAGFALVVVTNQSAVARGWCSESEIHRTTAEVSRVLALAGVRLDATYACLYSPEGHAEPFNRDHPTRKPRGGMILQAVRDLQLDLLRSWMIGDASRDIEAGIDAGIDLARTIVVGDRAVPRYGYRAADLMTAASIVLREHARATGNARA